MLKLTHITQSETGLCKRFLSGFLGVSSLFKLSLAI